MTITVSSSLTVLDETAGLQNLTATGSVAEDANDTDILVASLPSIFSTLGAGTAIGAALSGYTGAAGNTGSDAFTLSSSVTDISFVGENGAPLNGLDSGLVTLDGTSILLYTSTADNNVLLGRAGVNGPIVFAAYIEETATGGKIWTAQYQPLEHPDATDPDDAIDLSGIVFIGTSQDVQFSLANAPSGQNLFLMFTTATPNVVGGRITDPTIIATGKNPADQSSGANITTGDTINTSQAGGPTTFGTNNQMITEQEGIRFTFVTGARQDLTIPNLDQNEADLESNIDFTSVFNARAASFDVVQLQSGKSAVVKISAFTTAAETGTNFVNGYGNDTKVDISNILVKNSSTGQVVNDPGLVITITDGIATIFGVKAGYRIEYATTGDHNRVLVENGAALDAKGNNHADFDIGGFKLTHISTDKAEIGSKIVFEDDGPSATGTAATGTVDEDGLSGGVPGGVGDVTGAATSANGSVAGIFQSGADTPLSYALSSDTSGLPQTLTSGGTPVTYSVVGNTLTASAGAVDVFTFSLDATTGAYIFTLLKPLDHAAGNDENDITLNLGSLLRATDADGDTVTAAAEKLVITVDDDTPTAAGAAATSTVDEDGLTGGIPGGVGDVAGAATSANGSVAGIFQSGADTPLSYALSSDTSGLPQTLTSGGTPVTYSVVGNTLTASAGAVDVFTFSLDATTGDYIFTLLKPLDHSAGNDENDITLNLGSLLRATDADGDTVTAAPEKLVITVDDDTPTATGAAATGTVDEDGLANGIPGGTGDVANEPTVASGSVTGIFQSGADAPLSYTLSSDTSGLPQTLTSGGVAVTYNVVGDTLTASAGAVAVFTFSLTTAGAYTFTLLKPLDHAAGGDENDITLNLGSLLRATDADGDTVTAAAEKLVITVDDDTPTATGAAVTGTVDEDGLTNGIAGGTGDVTGEATTASGSVTGIFQSGADAPLTYGLSSNTSGLQALSSGGTALVYSVAGNTLTAKAGVGGADVFTFSLTAAGVYTFTLLKSLDHAAGNDENDLTLNLGSLLQATDKDGDTVTAAPEQLIITVDDDTPTLAFGNLIGTGTVLPQRGYWNMASGADGLGAAGLDISLVNGQFTLVRPDNTTTTGSGTLTEQSPSPDANGAYHFAGTLTGDFDNNANTANTSIDYTLTAFANGTYELDLVQGFSSTIVLSSANGSLGAGGPDPVRTLLIPTQNPPTIPSPSEEIVFFGVNAGTTATQIVSAIVQGAPDLTEAQVESGGFSFLGTANMNVSTSGIGIANNNLDGNGTAGINAGDESFVINPESLLTGVKVFIDNAVGGYTPSSEELYYRIFFDDGLSSAQTKVLAANLTAEAGGQKSFLVQWDGTKMIDAVQLTMGLGVVKIPVIQFIKQTESLASDIQLAFSATLTDKDGDTATSTFDANLIANDPADPLFDFRLAGTSGERDAFNIDLSSTDNLYQVTGFDAGPSLRDTLVLNGDQGAVVQSIDNTGPNSIVTIDETGVPTTTITVVGVALLSTDIVFGSA
ncbi:DUF5801 repeats-in-toxin domain-containing protein [Pseudomonas sp. CR3202]|uniref:T1SS-143 repeat domain-containing protein n=1 Tax=Pseudomonas sp. CR3202 TaxID=3351532 RepID=UPI003BEFE5FB